MSARQAGARLAVLLLAAVVLGLAPAAWADDAALRYQVPPDPIPALLSAPGASLTLVSPRGDRLALFERGAAPPIAELAAPTLGLAGQVIDPGNNGPSGMAAYEGVAFIDLATGERRDVALPQDARIIAPVWSPDGGHVAFLMPGADAVALWIASAADGRARRVVDGVNAAFPRAYEWLPGGDGFVVRLVVPGRGPAPEAAHTPVGPVVQENVPGRAAPLQTIQNLLAGPADEALFEHYFTAVLARIGLDGAAPEMVGEPGLILDHGVSPDGRHVLQTRLKRPFSYAVPASSFPAETLVTDMEAGTSRQLADRPLQELAPGDVSSPPRAFQWRADAPAEIVWAEAQDGGPVRDRLFALASPFTGPPTPLLDLEHRFSRVLWGRDDFALVLSSESAARREHRTVLDPSRPGQGRPLGARAYSDRSGAAAAPLTRIDDRGRERLHLTPDGRAMFAFGGGPLFRVSIETGEASPYWTPEGPGRAAFRGLLDPAGDRLLIQRESGTEPPNLFVLDTAAHETRQVTRFVDPAPDLANLRRQHLRYRRADGVALNGTLYLPVGHDFQRDGPAPLVVWAYPVTVRERPDSDGEGRQDDRFVRPLGFDNLDLMLLTQGYAVLRAGMPIVARNDGSTPDHTAQAVANAQAAIEAAAATGLIDPARAAVGGHSFGSAMAANLLAHSDLFRAGFALSGAYNRTLTPFGFQTERRTFWEAPAEYMDISPFAHADRINEPILLIHGLADSNSGTLPMQSERLYAALKGQGATARLVLLPHEGHAYRARESLMHVMWELTRWLDLHVRSPAASTAPLSEQDGA